MSARRLTALSLLLTLGLALYVLEAQLPPIVPVPGVKLGLANIVTLLALRLFGGRDALLLLTARILLAGMFAGQLVTLLFSLSGGILSLAVALPLNRFFPAQRLWLLSIISACAHNLGQILCAALVMGSSAILWYLPVLLAAGLFAGALTGLAAQMLLKRIAHHTN